MATTDTPPIALNLARIVHRLLVDPRGWRVDQLMDALDIKDRTYRKYRARLQDEMEPHLDPEGRLCVVEVTEGDARYLRLQANGSPVDQHPDFLVHVAGLEFARRAFAFARDAGLEHALAGVYHDFVSRIADKPFFFGHLLKNLDRLIFLREDAPKDYSGQGDKLQALFRALFTGTKIAITYPESNGDALKTHTLCPLTMLVWRAGMYLVAAYKPDGRPYLFAVDRIASVDVSSQRFDYPNKATYTPETLFEGSFGIFTVAPDTPQTDVELLFDDQPWLKRYVRERRWHPSQVFEELDDGRMRMTFQVASMVEVWPWIRGFGDAVTVVRPAPDGA